MAFINCSFYSETLGFTTNMNVCLPQDIPLKKGGYSIPKDGYPVLYLLHGLGDDHTIWSRKCAIDRFASTYGIAVVMPNGGRSFYADMVYGYPYFTFISEELPKLCESFFPISSSPSKRFIGGLSMGGYGALKIALSHPSSYAGAISLSGVLDIELNIPAQFKKALPDLTHEFYMIFGDSANLKQSPHNLFPLVNQVNTSTIKPPLYICCGTEDFLYTSNTRFKEHLEALQYPFVYREGSGSHDFYYWEKEIPLAMEWIHNQLES